MSKSLVYLSLFVLIAGGVAYYITRHAISAYGENGYYGYADADTPVAPRVSTNR